MVAFATFARSTLVAALAFSTAVVPVAAQQRTQEIIITINDFRALDRLDALSKPDVFAVVTIAGETFKTEVAKGQESGTPNWRIAKRVPTGRHDVKITMYDKDVVSNDQIDINPRPNKRDLDFSIETPGCNLVGLLGARCDRPISRAGDEKKRADMTVTISVGK